MKKIGLLKQHKILIVLLKLSSGTKKNLKFEDIVVELFKEFPKDFHLKGYNKYPDSGDSIKRPLYTLRDSGILTARNMIFALTDKGIDMANKIKGGIAKKEIQTNENFDRYIEKEIRRIKNLNSLELFLEKHLDDILDTDFFDYLGVSVKVGRMDFKSRVNVMQDVAKVLKNQDEKQFNILYKFHNFMFKKFKKEINYKLNN